MQTSVVKYEKLSAMILPYNNKKNYWKKLVATIHIISFHNFLLFICFFKYFLTPNFKKTITSCSQKNNNGFFSCSIKIQDEDAEICERLQKGLRSKLFLKGRYAPMWEQGKHDYHLKLAHEYKKGLESLEAAEKL